jgi:tetratricopeptide (TPR) repeat protein
MGIVAALFAMLPFILDQADNDMALLQLVLVKESQDQQLTEEQGKIRYLQSNLDRLDNALDEMQYTKTLNDLRIKAAENYESGNYSEAARYNDEILFYGWDDDAMEGKLNSLIQLQKYDDAVFAYNSTTRQVNPAISNNVASALIFTERYDEADKILDNAIALDANYFPTLVNKAIVSIHQKDYDKAEKYLAKALELKPDFVPALNNLAVSKALRGDFQTATSLVDRALQLDSENPVLKNNKELFSAGKQDLPIRSVMALASDADLAAAYVAEAETFPISLGADYIISKGDDLFEKKNYSLASGYYDIALSAEPENTWAQNGKGNVLTITRNGAQAIIHHELALNRNPNDLNALNGLGNAYYELEDYENARWFYGQVLEIDGNNTNATNGLGNVYVRTGYPEDGIAQYNKTIDIDKDSVSARKALGYVYSLTGQYEKSKENYLWVLDNRPDDIDALFGMGFVLNLENRQDEARQYFDRAGHSLNLAAELIAVADQFFKLESLDAALITYEYVLSIDPDNVSAINGAANVLFKKGLITEAENLYKETLKIDDKNANALVGLGNVSLKNDDVEQATAYCNHALELKPGLKSARICLAAIPGE